MTMLDKKQKEIDDYLDWAYKMNLSEETKMAGIKKISAKYEDDKMNTYKVTVNYQVREDVIVKAESEEDARELARTLDADQMEFENRDVISYVEIDEVEEL